MSSRSSEGNRKTGLWVDGPRSSAGELSRPRALDFVDRLCSDAPETFGDPNSEPKSGPSESNNLIVPFFGERSGVWLCCLSWTFRGVALGVESTDEGSLKPLFGGSRFLSGLSLGSKFLNARRGAVLAHER